MGIHAIGLVGFPIQKINIVNATLPLSDDLVYVNDKSYNKVRMMFEMVILKKPRKMECW